MASPKDSPLEIARDFDELLKSKGWARFVSTVVEKQINEMQGNLEDMAEHGEDNSKVYLSKLLAISKLKQMRDTPARLLRGAKKAINEGKDQ